MKSNGTTPVICGEQEPDAIKIDGGGSIPAVCTLDQDHGGDDHFDSAFQHRWPRVRPVKVDQPLCEAHGDSVRATLGTYRTFCTLDSDHDGDHVDEIQHQTWPRDEQESAVEAPESLAPSFGTQIRDGFVYGRLDPFSVVLGFIGGVVFMAALVVLIASDH